MPPRRSQRSRHVRRELPIDDHIVDEAMERSAAAANIILSETIAEKDTAIEVYEADIATKERQLGQREREVDDLQLKLDRAKEELARHRPRRQAPLVQDTTWQEDIVAEGDTEQARQAAWRKSCIAGNMSQKVIHPDLRLRSGGSRPRKVLIQHQGQAFRFEDLPGAIQAMIFRIWMTKPGLIHALSRLDKSGATGVNTTVPDGFPRVFHWGRSRCAISTARLPSDVLKILLVSKAFHDMGATAFYSLNSFAFSSIGELGRFINGIGPAKRQRLQSLSICLIGANMPKVSKHSVRTRPFHKLPQLRRLKRLDIHLDESKRKRRKYEEPEVQEILTTAMKGQDNRRLYRSLRTVQGFDYFYQFRGLNEVNIYDYAKLEHATAIWDKSLLRDVRETVTGAKRRADALSAQLNRLTPFLQNHRMTDKTYRAIRNILNPGLRAKAPPLVPRKIARGSHHRQSGSGLGFDSGSVVTAFAKWGWAKPGIVVDITGDPVDLTDVKSETKEEVIEITEIRDEDSDVEIIRENPVSKNGKRKLKQTSSHGTEPYSTKNMNRKESSSVPTMPYTQKGDPEPRDSHLLVGWTEKDSQAPVSSLTHNTQDISHENSLFVSGASDSEDQKPGIASLDATTRNSIWDKEMRRRRKRQTLAASD